MSKNDTVYTVYIAGISYTPTAERYTIAIVGLSNATVEPEIPAVIADLADIFSQ